MPVCLCVCLCVYVSTLMCLCVYVCVCMCLCVYVSVCVCLCVYASTLMCLCVYVSTLMCLCVYVSVCSGEHALRDTLSQFETAYLSRSLSRLIDPINLFFSSSSASPPTDDEIDGVVKVISRSPLHSRAHHLLVGFECPKVDGTRKNSAYG